MIEKIPLYIYTTLPLSTHYPVDGHVGGFCNLAIMNSATVNADV